MGDKYTHLIHIKRSEMGHTYVLISDKTLQEVLSNHHEFVLELRIVLMLWAVKVQNTLSVL